jgi:hypothetical protein
MLQKSIFPGTTKKSNALEEHAFDFLVVFFARKSAVTGDFSLGREGFVH